MQFLFKNIEKDINITKENTWIFKKTKNKNEQAKRSSGKNAELKTIIHKALRTSFTSQAHN